MKMKKWHIHLVYRRDDKDFILADEYTEINFYDMLETVKKKVGDFENIELVSFFVRSYNL